MGKKKSFNEHIIDGEITTIIVKQRDGTIHHILIDTEDLYKVDNYRWQVRKSATNGQYYATYTQYLGMIDGKPQYKTVILNRVIMDVTETSQCVDHIEHNTLDNRKSKMRVISNDKNTKNRSDKNKNNKSGYRNVSWLNSYNAWCVQLSINGKNTLLGKFDDVHEAGEFAKEMRDKYYGEFAGKG